MPNRLVACNLAVLLISHELSASINRSPAGIKSFRPVAINLDGVLSVCSLDRPFLIVRADAISGVPEDQSSLIPDEVRCAFECSSLGECRSFNRKKDEKTAYCELFDNLTAHIRCSSTENNCQYYQVSVFTLINNGTFLLRSTTRGHFIQISWLPWIMVNCH